MVKFMNWLLQSFQSVVIYHKETGMSEKVYRFNTAGAKFMGSEGLVKVLEIEWTSPAYGRFRAKGKFNIHTDYEHNILILKSQDTIIRIIGEPYGEGA
jgi:hypothetical protein